VVNRMVEVAKGLLLQFLPAIYTDHVNAANRPCSVLSIVTAT